jgi:glycosyltransferase involved in cell wall biosynthesis
VKNRIYIIAPYPRGKAPSQRFRFEQYIPYLEDEGFEVHFYSFLSPKTWDILYTEKQYLKKTTGILAGFFNRWTLLFRLVNAKHIFIHREMAQIGPPIFEFILAKILRKKYIYDFDDAIWLPNYSEGNAKFQKLKYYKKVNQCIKWANKITAGNEYLMHYAKQLNKHVQIIPTTVDLENHHNINISYERKTINIGWTGTHTTLHYLEEIVPSILKLNEKYSFNFIVIANQAPTFAIPNLTFIPWKKETEIEDLAKIDIGVMPLKNDKWAKGKCGFKALQYMSLGIPTIASAVGVNSSIIKDGENGFLIEKPEDWFSKIALLLDNLNLRKEIGQAGMETVKYNYSVEANKSKYLNLFKE